MSVNFNIDEIRYYIACNKKRINVVGWGFSEENPQAAIAFWINDHEVAYQKVNRNDVQNKFVEYDLPGDIVI